MGEGKRANRIAFGFNKEHHRGNQNAQAIVELALTLPILLVLIVGALEFGRLWSTKIVLTNAAREGAYYLTTHSTSASTCDLNCPNGTFNAAYNEALGSGITLSAGDVAIEITSDPEVDTELYKAKVTVQTQVKDLLILGFFMCNVFHLTGSSEDVTLSSSVEMMIQ